MVARSPALATFVPGERPRVAVSADGSLAAIAEPTRVVVIALPACVECAEIVIDPESGASDIAWLGNRLAILARYAAHSVVHLIDPRAASGPRTIAEIRLEAPMKLYAAVGAHALAVGAIGAAVLAASDSHLTPYQFPARSVPVVAGAAGTQFVVATPGAIEEWDPQSRMPKRRLKLARPAVITAVGGSERVVWMTTQADPTRLDVFTFVNRGQPKAHELPEPIAHVASHPKSDVVVCLGADSGTLYAVDLDGKLGTRIIGADGIDRAESAGVVLGRMHAVLAAQAKRPVQLVVLDVRDEGAQAQAQAAHAAKLADDASEARQKSTLFDDDGADADGGAAAAEQGAQVAESVAVEPAQPEATSGATSAADMALAPAPVRKPSLHRVQKLVTPARPAQAPAQPAVARANPPSGAAPGLSTSLVSKLAAWRERTRVTQTPTAAPAAMLAPDSPQTSLAPSQSPSPSPPSWIARPSWRDDVHAWARAVAQSAADRDAPPATLFDLVLARFELPAALLPALALLYGAHLAGEPGAAPADVARVLGRRWDEALGRGALARSGAARYRDSRVRLAPAIQRVLDELPPEHGALVGTPGQTSLLGPCVVVGTEPIGVVAEACLPLVGGALLAVSPAAPPADALFEARAYGAVAVIHAHAITAELFAPRTPLVLVAPDDASADALGVPRLT